MRRFATLLGFDSTRADGGALFADSYCSSSVWPPLEAAGSFRRTSRSKGSIASPFAAPGRHYRHQLRPRSAGGAGGGNSIRIASFNIQVFGEKKLANPRARPAGRNRSPVRRRGHSRNSLQADILPQFVDAINSTGRHYDYVIGPRLGRTSARNNTPSFSIRPASRSIVMSLYTVSDPDDCCTASRWWAGFACAVPRRTGIYILAGQHPHRSR